MIWIASVAIGKRLDYEKLYYSDYLYNKTEFADEIWDYVTECDEIGQVAWKEKYKEYKIY